MAQTGTVLVETVTSFPPQMTSLLLPLESLMVSSLASINVNVRLGFCFSLCVHFFAPVRVLVVVCVCGVGVNFLPRCRLAKT